MPWAIFIPILQKTTISHLDEIFLQKEVYNETMYLNELKNKVI